MKINILKELKFMFKKVTINGHIEQVIYTCVDADGKKRFFSEEEAIEIIINPPNLR